MRSRRSGTRVPIEIERGFAPDQSFAQLARVMQAVQAELEALIPGAEGVVIPRPR